MNGLIPVIAASPLRQRLIDDMTMRRFSREAQRTYIRDVGWFATWLGRSPHIATAEDLRQFQIEQQDAGVPAPTVNRIVAALRFFFTHTLDRPDLACTLVRTAHARKIPVVLTLEEMKRLLEATTCLKHQAAVSVAYGAGLRVAEVSHLKVRYPRRCQALGFDHQAQGIDTGVPGNKPLTIFGQLVFPYARKMGSTRQGDVIRKRLYVGRISGRSVAIYESSGAPSISRRIPVRIG